MTTNNYNVNEVVHIKSMHENKLECELCDNKPLRSFQNTINHYIQKHNYKLLHVGTESEDYGNDGLLHQSVVLLGK